MEIWIKKHFTLKTDADKRVLNEKACPSHLWGQKYLHFTKIGLKTQKKMEQENHKHIILTGKEEVFIQLLKRSQY